MWLERPEPPVAVGAAANRDDSRSAELDAALLSQPRGPLALCGNRHRAIMSPLCRKSLPSQNLRAGRKRVAASPTRSFAM
jgi:hypothetical protein